MILELLLAQSSMARCQPRSFGLVFKFRAFFTGNEKIDYLFKSGHSEARIICIPGGFM